LNNSNNRRLSEKDDIKNDPSEQAGGSASVGVEYGKGSICIHYSWTLGQNRHIKTKY